MNKKVIFGLKAFRKLYSKVFGVDSIVQLDCEQDADVASRIIYDELQKETPSMIARFGATEMNVMINYLGIKGEDKNWIKYIRNKSLPWWWEENRMQQMQRWSGFFPPTEAKIQQFCELMLRDMQEVNVLGSWIPDEFYFEEQLSRVKKVKLILLEPYMSSKPWSSFLKGKKVLVIHPFAELIEQQYQKRETLFENPEVLPEFELQTIPAIQSLGGESNGFTDWFHALQWMKDEIDKRDYDICLIGAGAYGFPLAAHVKRQGKNAIHLGGALQLLFGIKGNRWEDPFYGVEQWGLTKGFYTELMNEYWVRPTNKNKPKNANEVEGSCYW
ncbi:hypothetical protein [Zobellia sp. B3R18]|uniref:hypothetical protein n=1 Tax=Zobellia sp. B3R18 TaxID=2841568 RepID=UPI001C06E56A|nr:hypothetical protein [Zobellia sp. B3R18]MBU2975497.1 hypothetical protein [Zobellia sp. B3R18]